MTTTDDEGKGSVRDEDRVFVSQQKGNEMYTFFSVRQKNFILLHSLVLTFISHQQTLMETDKQNKIWFAGLKWKKGCRIKQQEKEWKERILVKKAMKRCIFLLLLFKTWLSFCWNCRMCCSLWLLLSSCFGSWFYFPVDPSNFNRYKKIWKSIHPSRASVIKVFGAKKGWIGVNKEEGAEERKGL